MFIIWYFDNLEEKVLFSISLDWLSVAGPAFFFIFKGTPPASKIRGDYPNTGASAEITSSGSSLIGQGAYAWLWGPEKNGWSGFAPNMTRTEVPLGPQTSGSVGPKRATVGKPKEEARWVIPESFPK